MGNDLVGQTHVNRFLGRVPLAEIPHLPRLLLPHHPCEVGCAEAGIHATELGTHLPEDRLVRSNGDVADDVKNVAAADGVSVHRSDDRFGNVPEDPV